MFTFKETAFIIIAFITLTLVSYAYSNVPLVPVTDLPSTLVCEQDPLRTKLKDHISQPWLCYEPK